MSWKCVQCTKHTQALRDFTLRNPFGLNLWKEFIILLRSKSSKWVFNMSSLFYYLFISLSIYFFIFRTTTVTYGSSQARGWIGAAPAGLHHSHSNAGSKPHLQLHHRSWQCQILIPLSEARDQTHILMDTS